MWDTHQLVASCTGPDWARVCNPSTWPWLGIRLKTLLCTGWCSNHRAHWPGLKLSFFNHGRGLLGERFRRDKGQSNMHKEHEKGKVSKEVGIWGDHQGHELVNLKAQNGMVVTIPLFIVGFYLEYSFLSNPLHSSVIRPAGLISCTVEQWEIDPYANTTPNELKEMNCITIGCPTTLPFGNLRGLLNKGLCLP